MWSLTEHEHTQTKGGEIASIAKPAIPGAGPDMKCSQGVEEESREW